MATLLADFGHDIAIRPPAPKRVRAHDPFPERMPVRGRRGRGQGWSPAFAPMAQWQMTSDMAPALWPLISGTALPQYGAPIGFDSGGAAFYAGIAEWVMDPTIPVTNTNVIVTGHPGLGKSATVKAFCARMMPLGYRTLILGDIKGEYDRLCALLGVTPIAVGPGLSARVNPLSMGPLGQGWEDLSRAETQRRAPIIFGRWLQLVRGLVSSQRIGELPVPFTPSDENVVSLALHALTGYASGATRLTERTIPQLWHALDEPSDDLIRLARYADRQSFLDETRLLRDSLGQLVSGSLAGLFDAPTNLDLDWTAPIQSLNLKRLRPKGEDALGVALTCMNSWGRGMREIASAGDRLIVVRDEAWYQMRLGVEAVKSLDGDLRLSRSTDGDINVLVMHKPSDPLSAGAQSSQATAIAKDLLHLAAVKVLHGQDAQVGEELAELLDLGPRGQATVTGWARQEVGRALWLLGTDQYAVQTVLHPLEKEMTFTNEKLLEGTS